MPLPVKDINSIDKAGEFLVRAINEGDISAVSGFFAPNAVLLPPGRPQSQGSAIPDFLRNMALQNQGVRLLSTEMEELAPDTVRDTGTLSMRVKRQRGERVFYKYLIVWQRVGADWKLSTMVWNRAAPVNREGGRGSGASGGGGATGGSPGGGGSAYGSGTGEM